MVTRCLCLDPSALGCPWSPPVGHRKGLGSPGKGLRCLPWPLSPLSLTSLSAFLLSWLLLKNRLINFPPN